MEQNPGGDSVYVKLDELREKITRLYIDENRTLKDVMQIILHEDGCHASSNMYQKIFRKWGLQKNSNHRAMTAFLQAIRQRKERGWPPITWKAGGRVYTEQDAAYFFRDKVGYQSLEHAIVGDILSTSEAQLLDKALESNLHWWHLDSNAINNHPASPPIPMQIRLPDMDQLNLQLLNSIEDTQRQILQPLIVPRRAKRLGQDLWDDEIKTIMSRRAVASHPPYDFFSAFNAALNLLNSKATLQEGFAAIERAFTYARSLVNCYGYTTLINLQIIMVVALEGGHQGIVELLAKHLLGYSNMYHGPYHPFTRWCKVLLQGAQSIPSLLLGIRAVADKTSEVLGPEDLWGTCLVVTAVNFDIFRGNKSFQEVDSTFQSMVKRMKAGQTDGVDRYNVLLISCDKMYGWWLITHGMPQAAIALVGKYTTLIEHEIRKASLQEMVNTIEMLLICHWELGELDTASRLLYKLMAIVLERFGREDPITGNLIISMVEAKDKHGPLPGITLIDDQVKEVLAPFYLAEERIELEVEHS